MTRWASAEGLPFPLGVSWCADDEAYNFAIYSKHATAVRLLLFAADDLATPRMERVLGPRRAEPPVGGLAEGLGRQEQEGGASDNGSHGEFPGVRGRSPFAPQGTAEGDRRQRVSAAHAPVVERNSFRSAPEGTE